MAEAITSKARMYDLLGGGALGNTVGSWTSLRRWLEDPEARRYEFWGVRTFSAGGPCRLYCPSGEVEATVRGYESKGHACQISIMVDALTKVTLWADVYDSPTGLVVYGVENPPKGGSWRALMPSTGKQYEGLAARMILRKHLNASSLADLEALFETYPGHVVELSALASCFGTVPGRNCVIWECRCSDGLYEKW